MQQWMNWLMHRLRGSGQIAQRKVKDPGVIKSNAQKAAEIAQAPADAVFALLSKTMNPTPPFNLQTNTPTNHIKYAEKQTPTSNPKKTKLRSSSPSTSMQLPHTKLCARTRKLGFNGY